MEVSLTSDVLNQLNTAEAKALHDISDSLSACGVGKIVNLPQIIVVGEQSSGKSSVLEAISHVRFPVERGLCTRFATELVLRQAPETRVNVSVRFADKSKAPQSFQRRGFHEDDLPEIIKEAKECMGFTRAGKDFSKDVLRLEIQGPGMYPLTLVDLPGLFHAETETQSLNGKETVDELVEGYMRQKNSIILVVIAANAQLASQVALRRVKEMDPQRQRTLGVITKPDLTHAGLEDEETYLKVAKNQEGANKFHLGWHVLRNRTEKETSLKARDETEEKFFRTGAWATLPRDDCGIATLRKKLSRVLYNHIRTSLPGVVKDIEGKLGERQEELNRLGKSRSTQEDMRSFLLGISSDFQRLARDGVYGRYNDAFFGGLDDDDRKLRGQLRNFNRAFDHILKTKGAKTVLPDSYDLEDMLEGQDIPKYLQEFLERYAYDFPNPEPILARDVIAQLEKQAARNQGLEFPGSPNKDLAIQLFKEKAAPWRDIAEFHLSRVTFIAKAFVDQLFKHVVGQPGTNRTTEAILSTCVDPLFDEKEKVLGEKLEELLRPYVEAYALPLDAEFYRSLSQQSSDPSDGEFGTGRVLDMMLVYYKMSRRTFTDNVINLAIESCLVRDIPDILTPTKVHRMSEARLEELAGESEDSKARRENLKEEIDILRQGLAQCLRYRPRPVTVLPSSKAKASSPSNALVVRASSAPSPPENPPLSSGHPDDPTSVEPAVASIFGSSSFAKLASTATGTGGLFGSKPLTATTAPVSSAPGTSSGLFGSKAAATNPPSSSSLFNKPAPAAQATSGLFGGTSSNKATTPVSSAPATSSSSIGFGSLSGGQAPTAAQPTSNLFGGSNSTKPASTANGTGGLFGSVTKNTTPVSQAPESSSSGFGSSGSSLFGVRSSTAAQSKSSPWGSSILGKPEQSLQPSAFGGSVFGNLPKTPNVSSFPPVKEANPSAFRS
ncbi:P-loop containing nucleoside triphosphate hydrolase protein [Dactylonectria macrodidyma]|uniref:P-loop containing nucleoside triphosphate hydrolase protein n=1 Tax=Dactylonectria macrodidyma TaxID=307937 RepID=A0A9P9I845_9HYPO|nr:P-loop containing nucleoside triphosphate hydrolase protein [Dactylonectria macrodidyma]